MTCNHLSRELICDPEMRVLDQCYSLIDFGDIEQGMRELFDFLFYCRSVMSGDNWKEFVGKLRRHKLVQMLHLCEIPRRSFERPRGYPGDAVLIDHLYGCGSALTAPHPASMVGAIYSFVANARASRAVRFRRGRLAALIDEAVQRDGSQTEVLSIAAGHLREIEMTAA